MLKVEWLEDSSNMKPSGCYSLAGLANTGLSVFLFTFQHPGASYPWGALIS